MACMRTLTCVPSMQSGSPSCPRTSNSLGGSEERDNKKQSKLFVSYIVSYFYICRSAMQLYPLISFMHLPNTTLPLHAMHYAGRKEAGPRRCKKCNKTSLGHPKGYCPALGEELEQKPALPKSKASNKIKKRVVETQGELEGEQ